MEGIVRCRHTNNIKWKSCKDNSVNEVKKSNVHLLAFVHEQVIGVQIKSARLFGMRMYTKTCGYEHKNTCM